MNPLMNEILAKERSQRHEREIAMRELIKKSNSKKQMKPNLLSPLKKLTSSLRGRRLKRLQMYQSQKASEALD